MRLLLVAVGTRQPGWVVEGFETYRRRFPPHLPLDLHEVPVGLRRGGGDPAAAVVAEGRALLQRVRDADRVIVLDERGRAPGTRAVAGALERWQAEGLGRVAFLIGGPDGLAAECRTRADETWSLSALTLPHGLVRVLVAEQLYRAWTISQGHPYHRDG